MLRTSDASLAFQQRYSFCEVRWGHLQAMRGNKLTSIKRTTDAGDDNLKSQEKAHAIQHGAVLVVNAVDPDGMDHLGEIYL